MKGKENKLSLEKYFDFVVSRKQTDLKACFLHQIINMHGFKRVAGTKSVVFDALKAIDLMNPSRSTLKENISSAASVTLNDILADLNGLSWQECCVTSMKILNSSQDEDKDTYNSYSVLQQSSDVPEVSKSIGDASFSSSSHAGLEIGKKPKKWKREARGCAKSSTP